MKKKASDKKVEKTDLIAYYVGDASKELREMMLEQYLSNDALTIYCDGSSKEKMMSVACSYVKNGEIIIESELVYPPIEVIGKNIYSELQALIFGLDHYEKHMQPDCKQVTFYTDVNIIKGLLANKLTFKNNSELRDIQSKLVQGYQLKKDQSNIPILIEYLPLNQKRKNPFAKISHNGAYNLLK